MTYVIIQRLIVQLLQLGLVVSELDPIQHLCEQEDEGVFVPEWQRESEHQVKEGFARILQREGAHVGGVCVRSIQMPNAQQACVTEQQQHVAY